MEKIDFTIDIRQALVLLIEAIEATDQDELQRVTTVIECKDPEQPLTIFLRCNMRESVKFGKYGPREPEWHFRDLIIEELSFLYGENPIEFMNSHKIIERLIAFYHINEI